MYVNGLRKEAGQAIADCRPQSADSGSTTGAGGVGDCGWRCPKCGCDDPSMLETLHTH
jgi:hypothetical protein